MNKRQDDKLLAQDLRLLRIFNYYRVALSCIFLFTFFNSPNSTYISLKQPTLFMLGSITYAIINIALVFILRKIPSISGHQVMATIVVDILILACINYASGGVNSGLGNLLIFSIAAGSILLSGRYSTMFAALASIVILLTEVHRAAIDAAVEAHYVHAGLLGMIFFATAFFIRSISKRIKSSEHLARQRASNIAHLEKLNRLIIQRMRTGIVVTSQQGEIRMINKAAAKLLNHPDQASDPLHQFKQLPTTLMSRLQAWQINPSRRTQIFRIFPENPDVQANFTSLRQEDFSDILIFLEDVGKSLQQAQQLKLASLGQLTANIAHEIRNPLGAISHAAQLLSESPNLDDGDLRLATIIQNHSLRMNTTIENVLELSRRQQPSPELLELSPWLAKFIESYNQTETEAGIFSVDVEPADLLVYFDPSQLDQILTNLSKNGLRYSLKKTGKPTLVFGAGVLSDSELPYLDVKDQGAGVDEQTKPHLFEPFYTSESTGTGLGLYLCKELCEANNAYLDHIASYQGGSCFRIIFPHPKQIRA